MEWDKERGILIQDYRKIKPKHKGLTWTQSPAFDHSKLIDSDSKYYDAYLYTFESKNASTFIEFIKMVIEEEFDGQEGRYRVVGYDSECKKGKEYLAYVTILTLYYEDDGITLVRKRTTRKRYGKQKRLSRKYPIFKEFPELEYYVN